MIEVWVVSRDSARWVGCEDAHVKAITVLFVVDMVPMAVAAACSLTSGPGNLAKPKPEGSMSKLLARAL